MKTAETLMHELGTTEMPEEDVLGPSATVGKSPKLVKVSTLTADDVRSILLEGYRAGMEAAARMCAAEARKSSVIEESFIRDMHWIDSCHKIRAILMDAAKTAQLP